MVWTVSDDRTKVCGKLLQFLCIPASRKPAVTIIYSMFILSISDVRLCSDRVLLCRDRPMYTYLVMYEREVPCCNY